MKNKLIIVEGLPGSGKSTTAQYIATQLNRNDIPAKWYYEMELDNPLDYQFEAYLTQEDYINLLSKYPLYNTILNKEVIKKEKYCVFYYLILNDKYNNLPSELINDLESIETNHLTIEDYMKFKQEKWKIYFNQPTDEITVIESSFLQGPIVELLLRNVDKEVITQFIRNLYEAAKDANPLLIYYYQDNLDEALLKMFEFRGEGFKNYTIDLVQDSPYGKRQKLKGLDLVMQFFRDYRKLGDEMISSLNISTLYIENSKQNWNGIYQSIHSYLKINRIEDITIEDESTLDLYVGSYKNDTIDRELTIKKDKKSLYIYFNDTYKERMIPINTNTFMCSGTSFNLHFIKESNQNTYKFMIEGRNTAVSFGKVGLEFNK